MLGGAGDILFLPGHHLVTHCRHDRDCGPMPYFYRGFPEEESVAMMQEICRFEVRNEGGEVYTLRELQRLIKTRPLNGPSGTLKGTRRFELMNGQPVNQLNENTFQIVETDEVLIRVQADCCPGP